MGTLLKIVILLSIATLLVNVAESCCCSHWWGHTWCGCNIFGCNCEFEGDSEYCYYFNDKKCLDAAGIPECRDGCFKTDEKTCARFKSIYQVSL